MRRSRRLSVSVALGVAACLALVAPRPRRPSSAPKPDGPKKVVTAYFADWDVYGRGYFVKDMASCRIESLGVGNATNRRRRAATCVDRESRTQEPALPKRNQSLLIPD